MKRKRSVIATVVYLLKSDAICLARRKTPIHIGKKNLKKSEGIWTGYGGKREEEDMSVRDTAIRELTQESGVDASPHNLIPAAKLRFFWHGNKTKTPDMDVYFFFLGTWTGKPQETEEMGEPRFFKQGEIPFQDMIVNDSYFLPKILANEKVVADVFFDDAYEKGMKIVEKKEQLIV